MERKESDCNLMEHRNQSECPRRIYYSDSEINYMDHEGQFWDEMSGKQLNFQEVIPARLDEIKHWHSYDFYENVPVKECWDSTGRAPVKVKWVDINKGDSVNHYYRSRLVAEENKVD